MNIKSIEIDKTTWWIAHSKNSLHFSVCKAGEKLSTGQENLEIFEDESEWADRVRYLGGQPYPEEDEFDDVEYEWDEETQNWIEILDNIE